jgi:hypothetical protein
MAAAAAIPPLLSYSEMVFRVFDMDLAVYGTKY